MSTSTSSSFCTGVPDAFDSQHSVGATATPLIGQSGAPHTFFAGANNTNANNGTFNNIRGDQINNTSVTYASELQNEKILATLNPVNRGGHHVMPCMKGTREHVFKQIDEWLEDVDDKNVLWLSGSPGVGKSTIASTIVSRLTERGRSNTSFFFRRAEVTLSDPAALWRTVAYDLASHDPTFTQVLTKTLKRVDMSRPDMELHFKLLIQEPLQETYSRQTPDSTPIIVIDALDECGSDSSHEAQRSVLLETLAQWSQLPKIFKLIVTSRDDRISKSFRAACKHIALSSGGNVDTEANADIRCFFERQFDGFCGSKWPDEQVLDDLTARAAGLFIWARIVVTFVKKGLHDKNLALVLDGYLGKGDDLTKLYQQILEFSFQDMEESTLEVFKLVISTILLAKVPLHRSDLYLLTSETQLSVDSILDKLSSVITATSSDECLRFVHLSFREFLCDRNRCQEAFFIDQEKESRRLATGCFQQMKMLKFNICDLKTSYLPNNEVEDLPELIKKKIPGALSYSCRFWADHLRDTGRIQIDQDILLHEVKDFLYRRFLFWLEVMSLIEEIQAANISLLTAVLWIEEFDRDLSAFAKDASRFINNFHAPISKSAPHIYLSALPFSPSESLVAKRYQQHFQNTISVVSGRDKNWPPLVNILRGHEDGINSIALSPDGRRVVSGSDDMTIRLWDVKTGLVTAGPLKGHTGAVYSVAFSPNGKQVVSGPNDGTIRMWDVQTGQLTTSPFEGHTEAVFSVGFSPNGEWVVSGSKDETIRVWDAQTGQLTVGPFKGHTGRVMSVGFSPNGNWIVSGSVDKTICVWDVKTGRLAAGPFQGHEDRVRSVIFSPDSKWVASGSDDRTIRVWDVETGQLIAGPFKGHGNWVYAVAFSPNGKWTASGSLDKMIRVWDVKTGQEVCSPLNGHTGGVSTVTFSPCGRQVISGSWNKLIRVWDVEPHQLSVESIKEHACAINSVALSFHGEHIVSGSKDHATRILDVKTAQLATNTFQGHHGEVNSVVFSPDSKWIASGSSDTTICVWDVDTGQVIAGPFKGHAGTVWEVAFSPDGKQIASGSSDKTIRVWDVETGQPTASPFEGHTDVVFSVAFSPDGKRIASGSRDKMIRVWDPETGQPTADPFEGHTGMVLSVIFSPDGTRIASSSWDKTIRVWDVETGRLTVDPFEGHTEAVISVAFSPDGKWIASGSWDKTIRVWDVETGRLIIDPFGHTFGVNSVAFSSDGKHIVSGSDDCTVRMWNVQTGQLSVDPFEGHTKRVRSVAFSSDGEHIASGSDDWTICVWDVDKVRSHTNRETAIGEFPDYYEEAEGPGWLVIRRLQSWLATASDETSSLLLWVPKNIRDGLCLADSNTRVFGARARLDLSRFHHGDDWTQCYSSPTDTSPTQVVPSLMQSPPVDASTPDPDSKSDLSETLATRPSDSTTLQNPDSDTRPSDKPESPTVRYVRNVMLVLVSLFALYYILFYS